MGNIFQDLMSNCAVIIAEHSAQIGHQDHLNPRVYILAGDGRRLVRKEQGVPAIVWHQPTDHLLGVIRFTLREAQEAANRFNFAAETAGETLTPIHVDDWHRRQIAEAQELMHHAGMMLMKAQMKVA